MGYEPCVNKGCVAPRSICEVCSSSERADTAKEAIAAERARCLALVRARILERLEAGAATAEARTSGGQRTGPSSDPWARIAHGARMQIRTDVEHLLAEIASGAPAPREG